MVTGYSDMKEFLVSERDRQTEKGQRRRRKGDKRNIEI
jgi:hypothetical protein